MSLAADNSNGPRVAVVGGGLAGMAAAWEVRRRGLHVELFDEKKQLGGRAGSFFDPQIGRLVDFCQHVSMGCCTKLAEFCRQTGVADCFRRDRRLHFFGPDAVRRDFAAVGWLPPPLHLAPGLMRLKYLTLRERLSIARTLLRLKRPDAGKDQQPADESIGDWLRRHGQTERAVERFWSVVLVSALSETPDRASLAAGRKVFVDGFLSSRRAYELEVPREPLAEIFDRRVGGRLTKRGVIVHRCRRVLQVDGDARRAFGIVLVDGTQLPFDFVIVAVPWRRVGSLFPPEMRAALPELDGLSAIQPAAITAVHMWFDRPVLRLPHAVSVGGRSPWFFEVTTESGAHCQAVISAADDLVGQPRRDVLAGVLRDLERIRPEMPTARLLHHRVVTQPAAVFSVQPGISRLRPAQRMPIKSLALAGDWTDTGWPATMESAVRSGLLAAEVVMRMLPKAAASQV